MHFLTLPATATKNTIIDPLARIKCGTLRFRDSDLTN